MARKTDLTEIQTPESRTASWFANSVTPLAAKVAFCKDWSRPAAVSTAYRLVTYIGGLTADSWQMDNVADWRNAIAKLADNNLADEELKKLIGDLLTLGRAVLETDPAEVDGLDQPGTRGIGSVPFVVDGEPIDDVDDAISALGIGWADGMAALATGTYRLAVLRQRSDSKVTDDRAEFAFSGMSPTDSHRLILGVLARAKTTTE